MSAATLDKLEALGGTVGGAVGVFRAVTARLAGFTGEDELVRAAAGRPDFDEAAAGLGHVVWYPPEPATPAPAALLAAVLQTVASTVIVGLTGAATPTSYAGVEQERRRGSRSSWRLR